MSAKVDQTILAGDPARKGNCVSACVATFLDVPLTSVPHFVEYDGATVDGSPGGTGWWWLMVGFMAARGLWPFDLGSVADGEPGELLFVAGMSERGVLHQVLYRDGALWHDPHPSRAGLTTVTEVLAWRPMVHDHEPTSVETIDVAELEAKAAGAAERHGRPDGCQPSDDCLCYPPQDDDCPHDWTCRPESDTWVCEMCGAER